MELKFARMFKCDFSHFYASALVLKSGLPSLYDDDKLLSFAQQAGLGAITTGARTAPAAVALLVPLTEFDLFTATKIFIIVNHLLLAGSMFLAARCYAILRPETRIPKSLTLLFAASVFISTPMLENLLQGQLNLICLFSTSLSYYLWLNGKSKWAGFWLWPAISAKLFPASLAFYYLLKRDYKAAVSSAVSTIAMNCLAGMVFGWHFAAQYPARLLTIIGGPFPRDFGNQSLRNAVGHWLEFFLGDEVPVSVCNFLWIAAGAASVTGFIWVVRRQRKLAQVDLVMELTLLTLTQYIISSYSTSAHHIGLYLPALLLALDFWHQRQPTSKAKWVLLPCLYLIASGDGFAARNLFYAYYQSTSCNLYLPVACHVALWVAVFYGYQTIDPLEAETQAERSPS
jgi:alpha-1,2-mannosyltransferase